MNASFVRDDAREPTRTRGRRVRKRSMDGFRELHCAFAGDDADARGGDAGARRRVEAWDETIANDRKRELGW